MATTESGEPIPTEVLEVPCGTAWSSLDSASGVGLAAALTDQPGKPGVITVKNTSSSPIAGVKSVAHLVFLDADGIVSWAAFVPDVFVQTLTIEPGSSERLTGSLGIVGVPGCSNEEPPPDLRLGIALTIDGPDGLQLLAADPIAVHNDGSGWKSTGS